MSTIPTNAIEVNDVSFTYDNDIVLENISFAIKEKTLCALVGPNGAGKSTLIQCITGLLKPDSGTTKVHCAHDHTGHSIGYVPQRHIIPTDFPVSVYETVSTGRIVGQRKWLRFNKNDREIIEHSIESVGLAEHMHSRLDQLSGGQQQRVLIAKAFASEPDVLILDEPTAGVDVASQDLFRDSLKHVIEEHETTVLLVSHELSAVSELVDQILVLKNRILFNGTPNELKDQGVSLGIHEHDLPIWLERLDQSQITNPNKTGDTK